MRQAKDKATDTAYMVRPNSKGDRWRVYSCHLCHLRVAKGTIWRTSWAEAEKDLEALAAANGWVKH